MVAEGGALCIDLLCISRPLWLLALLPGVLILLGFRRRRWRVAAWERLISPELLPHLLRTRRGGGRRSAIPLALATLLSLVLALAGPVWRGGDGAGEDPPAPLLILLDLSAGMAAGIGSDTPLARARFKLRDLLQARRGAPTALLVFAGGAHTVLPLTDDSETLDWYLQELDPALMPVPGFEPLAALERVAQLGAPADSGLLLVTRDPPSADDRQRYLRAQPHPMAVLALDASAEEVPRTTPWSRLRVEAATLDNQDLQRLQAFFNRVRWQAGGSDGAQEGTDLGYPLVWLFALLLLGWFQPGRVMQWR